MMDREDELYQQHPLYDTVARRSVGQTLNGGAGSGSENVTRVSDSVTTPQCRDNNDSSRAGEDEYSTSMKDEYSADMMNECDDEEEDVFVRRDCAPEQNLSEKCSRSKVQKLKKSVVKPDRLPVDRGWAWVVLAGTFLNVVIMMGYARGMAILFVEYIKLFEDSTTKTTLIMGVMSGVYSFSSLISMHIIIDLLGVRKTVLLGAAVTTIGMVQAIFPMSITYLICMHSTLVGIGHSMLYGPALVLISQYFDKRRGLATAVAMSGISVGSSVFPIFIRFLLNQFTLRGTMIILTAVTTNLFVGGAVKRPFDSFKPPKCKKHKTKPQRQTSFRIAEAYRGVNPHKFLSDASLTSEMLEPSPTHRCVFLRNELPDSPEIVRRIDKPLSRTGSMNRRALSRTPSGVGSQPLLEDSDSEEDTSKSCAYYAKKAATSLDFSLFKMPMFLMISCYTFFAIVIGAVPAYIPALAREKDIDQDDAAIFLLVAGGVDFFSRLCYGYLADLKILRVTTIMALGLIVTGTVSHFTNFFNSYISMLAYSLVIGMFSSSYFCLIPVAIADLMGQHYLAKTLGFVSLFHGISMALTHPIIGGLRDYTGSYIDSFRYMGVSAYIAGILLLCVPLLKKHIVRDLDKQGERDVQTTEL